MKLNSDTTYMKMALNFALKAKGQTSPNPMVGALIVKNNRIIAKGYHRRCGADHAEIEALKKAGRFSKGAKLYVTLEPCGHFGRTPPCVDAIINSGIKEVVIGTEDPNIKNNGKSIQKLNRAGVKTKVGILADELFQMNEAFFKYIKKGMPFVVVKCAQTMDGKIATSNGHSKWITSEETRKLAHELRNDFDAILVGINTVVKDNPFLNATKESKELKKIIVDSSLRISLGANLFKKTNSHNIYIATTESASIKKIENFRKKGINVFVCSSKDGRVDLKKFFKILAGHEITSILVEGGATIVGSVLKQGLADKMWIFIAPKIIGDQEAKSAITGLGIKNVNRSLKLGDMRLKYMKSDIFIEAYIK
ncbi:MAG: bifunctional diaminohydroxyphosphoribosylaminopyrimidine deaminase/5-amino-6-(5-phosphoribosylamino)uracil reductase RibD [Candidatus Omnitrophica bacterium]|nr:bifunctional diaminohydroxyphosphoribosylaminopyrimidine deaminase/5-amino-6-(5-phosphoribosylamino)uracil reductase RibD [Candidatus Omnitrophota bacterium]